MHHASGKERRWIRSDNALYDESAPLPPAEPERVRNDERNRKAKRAAFVRNVKQRIPKELRDSVAIPADLRFERKFAQLTGPPGVGKTTLRHYFYTDFIFVSDEFLMYTGQCRPAMQRMKKKTVLTEEDKSSLDFCENEYGRRVGDMLVELAKKHGANVVFEVGKPSLESAREFMALGYVASIHTLFVTDPNISFQSAIARTMKRDSQPLPGLIGDFLNDDGVFDLDEYRRHVYTKTLMNILCILYGILLSPEVDNDETIHTRFSQRDDKGAIHDVSFQDFCRHTTEQVIDITEESADHAP